MTVRLLRARLRRTYWVWKRRRAQRRLTRVRQQRIAIEADAERYDVFPLWLTLYWIGRLIWTATVRRVFP